MGGGGILLCIPHNTLYVPIVPLPSIYLYLYTFLNGTIHANILLCCSSQTFVTIMEDLCGIVAGGFTNRGGDANEGGGE